MTLFN